MPDNDASQNSWQLISLQKGPSTPKGVPCRKKGSGAREEGVGVRGKGA